MAHFARIVDGIVADVIVVNNDLLLDENGEEQESLGVDFCNEFYGVPAVWVQTSYHGAFRKNFAGRGYTYDESADAFIGPQPYPSWTLNETTYKWEPPVAYPDDRDNYYRWDETTTSWVLVGPLVDPNA